MNKLWKYGAALLLAAFLVPLTGGAEKNPFEHVDTNRIPYFASYGGPKGHAYYVFPAEFGKTYDEAKAYCASHGGYLAVIDSDDENRFVYRVMRDMGYDHAYIGLETDKDGDWVWANGKGLKYKNWKAGKGVAPMGRKTHAMLTYAPPVWVLPNGAMTEKRPTKGNSYEFLPDANCAWTLGAYDSPGGDPFICEWGE